MYRISGERELPRDITMLRSIYREVDRETSRFAREANIACPDGCGICSENTDPECLPIEAELVARYLLTQGTWPLPERSSNPPSHPGGCPLYSGNPAAHCTVYPARPVLCRLFGFSATGDSTGAWHFRLCKHMPAPPSWEGRRDWSEGEDSPIAEIKPPLMERYGRLVADIRPADIERRGLLSELLPEAAARLILRRHLSDAERFNLGRTYGRSSPDDNDPPTPRPRRRRAS